MEKRRYVRVIEGRRPDEMTHQILPPHGGRKNLLSAKTGDGN